MSSIFSDVSQRAIRYRELLAERRVAPTADAVQALDQFSGPVPDVGESAERVISDLDEIGSAATVATADGRYFGYVIGAGVPVTVAANWLAGIWNQNVAMEVMSPVSVRLERIALEWTRQLLDLPEGSKGACVTGDTMANFAALAAARHAVLARVGHDVAAEGLNGAPRISVLVSEEVHISVLRAISLLGLGCERVIRVPVDSQGRMRAEKVPEIRGPTIVCTQAGNVNTGSFDPLREISTRAHASGAWVHVDGAFGLWARAAPGRRGLAEGIQDADSWSLDCHKWLNVPYDNGIVCVRDGHALRAAMATAPAAYLPTSAEGEPMEFTPEMSRRARGIDVWAALRFLGRTGVADIVERSCRYARRFAERLREAGFQILNDVVLNQVLVSFGDDDVTRQVIAEIQQDGTCWCGGTVWRGTAAMRISVSSWATTEADVDRSADAIVRIGQRGGATKKV